MTMDTLRAGQVKRSPQRFSDFGADLSAADQTTIEDRLAMFVEFCSTDPTISIIHEQLLNVPNVDLATWMLNAKEARTAIFSTNLDQRLSLMYQIVPAVRTEKLQTCWISSIEIIGSSATRIDRMIAEFTTVIVQPMVRELRYRLADIHLPPDDSQIVGASVVQVIANSGTLVQQVAPHSSQVTMNTAMGHAQLQSCARDLLEAVRRSNLEDGAKRDAEQVATAIAEELSSSSPRGGVLRGLMNSLPTTADIAQIVGTIAQLLNQAGIW